MFFFGAIGTFAFGVGDISEVMFKQGLMIPAIFVLGFNIWTTNDNALYASGLGFSNITKIRKEKTVIFNGIAGTIAALWLYNHLTVFLTFLGSTLPSIGAIILADYFILKKGAYESFETMKFSSVNWLAIVAWVCGVLAGNVFPGVPPINGVIVTAVIYVTAMKVAEKVDEKRPTPLKEKVG